MKGNKTNSEFGRNYWKNNFKLYISKMAIFGLQTQAITVKLIKHIVISDISCGFTELIFHTAA